MWQMVIIAVGVLIGSIIGNVIVATNPTPAKEFEKCMKLFPDSEKTSPLILEKCVRVSEMATKEKK